MIGNKEDRDASRPESEVTTNGIIRMDTLFQAFPPQSKEPHVQVSSHTAQAAKKSDGWAGLSRSPMDPRSVLLSLRKLRICPFPIRSPPVGL